MRKVPLVLAAALLATCAGGPPVRPLLADDHDRLIALMGGIDAELLKVQRGAADPLEPETVRAGLAAMRGKLEQACLLEIRHDTFRSRAGAAIDSISELERLQWTPANRDDGYATLRGLCAGCHRALAPPLSQATQKPDSWQACGRCHERAFREWKETLHAEAWLDPVYRLSAGDPPKHECRSCHSMEPLLAREISTEVTYRPVFRPYLHEEGVNCIACHGLADGSVAAARDLPEAPCRPRRDERLRSPEFCGACHNPSHAAYDEWKLSKSGKTCADCHALRSGHFSHRMIGVRDPDFVRRALDCAFEVEGHELRISITNRSGHKLPAEVPSRMLRVKLTLDGHEEQMVLRRPNKQIVGEKDNRLLPEETRILRRPLGETRRVHVEILYQQSPFSPPREWIRMAEWSRDL